ncbi:hypothetical protein PCANC_23233 [Puccinia coronata f. sp. avenae]|uniref:Uncharacterized protein n=1 Tax=Puccinia coronata f. sp. avenae TaxID=200324 RepID=A0A2N5TKA5_9BASI|nr:hypothetical protein PCANC_23233 [Puccinia coronata f. sp. avenae]
MGPSTPPGHSPGFQDSIYTCPFGKRPTASRSLLWCMCVALLKKCTDNGPTHEEKIDELCRRFPRARQWLDWWNAANVSSMLFPSRRKLLDDSLEDDDGLPSTTNAQESMHRLYYMISDGKKSLMVGMTELFAFVKLLEEDWTAVMCGTSIKYGSTAAKTMVDVSQSMGWDKKRKRQEASKNESIKNSQGSRRHKGKNNGRAPDTTELLLPEPKKKKLGRPKNSKNIDQNPFTTYPLYAASNDARRANRCWLATALESL